MTIEKKIAKNGTVIEALTDDNFAEVTALLQAAIKSCQACADRFENDPDNVNDKLFYAPRNLRRAYERTLRAYLEEQASQLTNDLQATLDGKSLRYYYQSGSPIGLIKGEKIHIVTCSFGFEFKKWGGKPLATYDTPAQVKAVIARIKETVERGETEFAFPTIEQLTPVKVAEADVEQVTESAIPSPEQDYSPEYMLGIIDEVDALNENAPDGWQVEFNPVENNFSVAFNGASVADIDSLALAKILPPDKFFDRFKLIIDDAPQDLCREDLLRELDELQAMREQIGDDYERLKILDELIEQTKRELVSTEFKAVDFDENGNIINIWF